MGLNILVGQRWSARMTVSKFKISAINIKRLLPTVCVSSFIYGVSLIVVDSVQSKMSSTLSFPVCIENHLFIVWIEPILNKEPKFIFRYYRSDRTSVYRYQYYTVNFRDKNVTQSALFFGYKNVKQSVRIFVCKNVIQSALFFAYRNVTQSKLFLHIEMPPSAPPFSKALWKLRNAKCPDFGILKSNTNCLDFCEVSGLFNKNIT